MTDHRLNINDEANSTDKAEKHNRSEYIVIAEDGYFHNEVQYSPGAIIELEDDAAAKAKEGGLVRDKGEEDA